MVTAMTASKYSKKSFYVFMALLLTACQPPTSTGELNTTEDGVVVQTPLTITSESVTMTPEHILSVKPSRYQPSLGLQGSIEPIKKTSFTAVYPIHVEKVLVSEGQWVEKGTPLLTFRRVATDSEAVPPKNGEKNNTATNYTNQQAVEAKPENSASVDAAATQITADDDIVVVKGATDVNDDANDRGSVVNTDAKDADKKAVSNTEQSTPKTVLEYNLITVHASFSGRVENLQAKTSQRLTARTALLQLSDETKLHFVATLPIQAKPQLSVGQTVNFTAEGVSGKFTGQVSKLTSVSQPKRLLVHVNVIDNEVNRAKLQPNMKVTGRVNYGQIDVGTIVPEHALHDADLSELQKPPYMPLKPLTANVWIIGQDQRLSRQPIEVIEYDPTTEQYLIAGVSNDSLICLADLPIDSKGKKVIVS